MFIKIELIFLFFIVNTLIFAQNPFDYIIDEEKYKKCVEIFSKEVDIFNPEFDSKLEEKIKKRIDKTFMKVLLVLESENRGIYTSIFYYLNSEREKCREVIEGSKMLEINDTVYIVSTYKNGIVVKDAKTGINKKIEVVK